ncbi:MAG: retroviral-like aspartic protease [Microcoleaceae cyanobacterium]
MRNSKRFPYIKKINNLGQENYVPFVPITLNYDNIAIKSMGLLDTGATINVLPYDLGLELGATWENETISIPLAGNLKSIEARGLIVSGVIDNFSPARLAFAWAKSNDLPLILGQINFFKEFSVCFYGSEIAFEISQNN